MEVVKTKLPEVLLIQPRVFEDARGCFFESFNAKRFEAATGLTLKFSQDNVSVSEHGTLRGLHFQNPYGQGKLVQVLQGEVYDVAVDIRLGSPNYGQHVGIRLNAKNRHQLYIPSGFAHGFLVTSKTAIFQYKCTNYYHPESEYSLSWDDPEIDIKWPIDQPSLSTKDLAAVTLRQLRDRGQLPKITPREPTHEQQIF